MTANPLYQAITPDNHSNSTANVETHCDFTRRFGSYRRRQCEVGATERGCSGSIGSDDTRGYGAGSGDVGKELPRGMIP